LSLSADLRSAKLRAHNENIKNITYSIAITKPLRDCHKEFVPIKINNITTQDVRDDISIVTHHVNISPEKFVFDYKLNNINRLINLNSIDIPENAKFIL